MLLRKRKISLKGIAMCKNYLPLNKVNKGTIAFEANLCTLHKVTVNESPKNNFFVAHLF